VPDPKAVPANDNVPEKVKEAARIGFWATVGIGVGVVVWKAKGCLFGPVVCAVGLAI
jgi:hypothetical protein